MKKIVFIILFVCYQICAYSQYVPVNIKCMGGSNAEYLNCFLPLDNGDFVFAGSSNSSDGDLMSNNGNSDCWLVIFDTLLEAKNAVSFGESGYDAIRDVCKFNDSAFVLLISSNSTNGVFSGNLGSSDAWIRTYYPSNNWLSPPMVFGGNQSDAPVSIINKANGGYLFCGTSGSSDGDLPGNFGMQDIWVASLSSTFAVTWSKNYGGSSYDNAVKIFQLDDGNIMVFGNTLSNDLMVNDNAGTKDVWVIKLNSMGDTLWTRTYGGTDYDEILNVKEVGPDQFAMIGYSYSSDGDFFYVKNTSQKLTNSFGFFHVIDLDGEFITGGNLLLNDNQVQFKDVAYTCPQDAKVVGTLDVDTSILSANYDVLITAFNQHIVIRKDTFGGNGEDGFDNLFVHKLNDYDILLITTTSSDDLTTSYKGEKDVLLAKLRLTIPSGISKNEVPFLEVFPNPASHYINILNLPVQNAWTYYVYDLAGKCVFSDNLCDKHLINLKDITNGLYMLTLTDGVRSFARRIVVHR